MFRHSVAVILCAFLCFSVLNAQQAPYGGTPAPIPGTIEAENYDLGGEGVAYHDADPANQGPQGSNYRPSEGVDIEPNTVDGGYDVGWTNPGEWLEYTINVATPGRYKIEVRVAAQTTSGSIAISFGGVTAVSNCFVPVTGGWQTWVNVPIPHIQLAAGVQVMRITMNTANFNISSIKFSKEVDTKYPVITLLSPADSSEFKVGEPIKLSASASDSDGTIQGVYFFKGVTLICQDTIAPYEFQFSSDAPGSFLLFAVALDNDGAMTISDSATIFIKPAALPGSPIYSVEHGFYSAPFDLTISSDSAGAVIKYTLDGSDPRTNPSALQKASPAVIHIDPAVITNRFSAPAVPVRAYALVNGTPVTDAGSQTYIFIDKVKTQVYPGGSWPSTSFGTNNAAADYAMDPNVVNAPAYKDQIDDALLQIPTICINTDVGNLFDPVTGIYCNPTQRGIDWERPSSVELIDPHKREPGFQINCGLRLRGGYSRIGAQPKHAFRFFFRDLYGKGKLKYPLFGDEGVSEFDCVDLRTAQNYSWSYQYNSSHICIFVRDLFCRLCQRDVGDPYTRSRNYHLYVNGVYWGLFQTEERPEASYAESYLGGLKDNYDVVKVDPEGYGIEATDGTLYAYNDLYSAARNGFSTLTNYFSVQGKNADGTLNPSYPALIDIDNLINYELIIFYTGNFDAPVTYFGNNTNPNNFYGMRDRTGNKGFIFFIHDAEHAMIQPGFSEGYQGYYGLDRTGPFFGTYGSSMPSTQTNNPQWIHERLMQNAEYRLAFADHVYRHFFNNGALTPLASRQRLAALTADIDTAVIAESARWGDSKVEPARTKNDDWTPAVDWLMNTYFPTRTSVVLQQLKADNLYPSIDPPVIMSGADEIMDTILFLSSGSSIRLVNNNSSQPGSILYTLDGTDPRRIGGAANPSATDGGDAVDLTISANVVLNARIQNGTTWSAFHRLVLHTGESQHGLKITEIHYNPLDDGTIVGAEFEFIELKNVSSTPLPLGNATFVRGIEYTFPAGFTMPGNSFFVLASDSVMFRRRYGFTPNGQYNLQLDNGGERLTIVGIASDTILSVHYRDKYPWPESADGGGYSIVAKNANGYGNPDSASYWRASLFINGSPGRDDIDTGIDGGSDATPVTFRLEQNYPNPFNPETIIRYQLSERRFVELKVYDVMGREISTLVRQEQHPGTYSVRFPATGLSSGIYFYQLKAGGFTATNKMVLVR